MPSFRILQPESYKLRIANMWEGRGKNYDASDTFHQALATRLVNIAKPQAGQNLIDIATGTGMVAVAVARKLGKSGHVTGVDISESMLAEARRKAMELQLTNCTFLQADAESVELQENSFDSVFCSSAMLYMQDISLALKRFHKWLKPGGCLYFNTPQEPCVPATKVFYQVLSKVAGVDLADAAEPLGNPDLVRSVCRECGFFNVEVHETEEVMLFKKCGPREYGERIWQSVASNAIMTPLEGLVEADLLNGAIKVEYLERTAELAEPWVVAEGIKNPYTMLWVTARK